MYAGTTYGKNSGQYVGVHQRIDKIARYHLKALLAEGEYFPDDRKILYFEGNNGPDGIKRKSPSIDEPWHFIDPKNLTDLTVMSMVGDHQVNLAAALKSGNEERSAFEAAWMAHAIVDGLTPAHHYPLGEKIEELFGMPHHERNSFKQKNVIKGHNRRDSLSRNWQYWGKRGVFMNHIMFELGVMTAILGSRFKKIVVSQSDVSKLITDGYPKTFAAIMRQVVELDMYEKYVRSGWSTTLAKTAREQLVPLIVRAVVLGWYTSIHMNQQSSKKAKA
jgi:hypothetical protein